MKRYKIGDTVRFYGLGWTVGSGAHYCNDPCKVEGEFELGEPDLIAVVNPISGRRYEVHPIQCVKLRERKSK